MHIDPHTTQEIADLGIRLADTALRNTAAKVDDKIRAIKAKKDDRTKIQELEEIIRDLIDDKSDLEQIAKAYKETFVAQQISQEDIKYITDSLIPVAKELIEQAEHDGNNAAVATSMKQGLDVLEPLLSVRMLTVLQLVGFNFKQAIGEPLTFLLQKFIASKVSTDSQSNAEYNKLMMAFNLEVAKIAQDKDATERWERLKK
ncbi:MAG TPA: hypothetical protein VGF67_33050 [Ktedonobacteraceae bacterium]|jgi:hypothetical protein